MTVKKGDVFAWNGEINLEVFRAAKDGTWADSFASGPHGGYWTKRLILPLDDSYVLVAEGVHKR